MKTADCNLISTRIVWISSQLWARYQVRFEIIPSFIKDLRILAIFYRLVTIPSIPNLRTHTRYDGYSDDGEPDLFSTDLPSPSGLAGSQVYLYTCTASGGDSGGGDIGNIGTTGDIGDTTGAGDGGTGYGDIGEEPNIPDTGGEADVPDVGWADRIYEKFFNPPQYPNPNDPSEGRVETPIPYEFVPETSEGATKNYEVIFDLVSGKGIRPRMPKNTPRGGNMQAQMGRNSNRGDGGGGRGRGGEGGGRGGSEKKNEMLGEKGVQTTSTTIWKGRRGERLDVENPNPGQRPGQIHYQDKGGKQVSL